MNSGRHRKWKKKRLFLLQRGLCYYCQCRMQLAFGPNIKGEKIPPTRATFEHLDHKLSGERGKHRTEFRIVLACFKCNQQRGQEFMEYYLSKQEPKK